MNFVQNKELAYMIHWVSKHCALRGIQITKMDDM